MEDSEENIQVDRAEGVKGSLSTRLLCAGFHCIREQHRYCPKLTVG